MQTLKHQLLKKIGLTALAVGMIWSPAAMAAEPAGEAPWGYGTRALGMGGAYVALADDASAAYWNPAGITRISRFAMTPSLTAGSSDMKNAVRTLNSSPSNLTQPVTATVNVQPLGFATSRFGVNFFGQGFGTITPQGDGTTTVDYTYNQTSTLTVALPVLNPPFDLGRLAVGVNIKAYRGEHRVGTGSLTSGNAWDIGTVQQQDKATGYGVDVGLQGNITPFLSFGATVRDVVSEVKWDNTAEGDAREPLAQVGVALQPPFLGLSLAADVEKGLDADSPWRYRVGLEKRILGIMSVRAGGYTNPGSSPTLTGGLGLGIGPVHVDAAVASADGFRQDIAGSLGLSLRF